MKRDCNDDCFLEMGGDKFIAAKKPNIYRRLMKLKDHPNLKEHRIYKAKREGITYTLFNFNPKKMKGWFIYIVRWDKETHTHKWVHHDVAVHMGLVGHI